jgi:hypothetical protein
MTNRICSKVKLKPTVTVFDYDIAFSTPLGIIRVKCNNGNIKVVLPDKIALE